MMTTKSAIGALANPAVLRALFDADDTWVARSHCGEIGRRLDRGEQITIQGRHAVYTLDNSDAVRAAFFPERGASHDLPLTICRTCPVRTHCLEYSLKTNQRYGIWGGSSERERRRLRRYRRKEEDVA